MKKTIWIIVGIVLCIIIAVPTFFLIGLGISEFKTNQEKTQLEKQAIINVENYIKEKYPEMKLTIDSAVADETYNGWIQSGWDDIVDVIVKDQNNNTYNFITNASLIDKEGTNSCRDNVQLEEIKSAIINEIEKTVVISVPEVISDENINIIENKKIDIDFISTGYDTLYHQKFDGDIVKFLKTEDNGYGKPLEIDVWIAYVNGEKHIKESFNTEFFNLLDFVAIIEFKDKIPSTPDYTHRTPEWIYETLERFDKLPKSLFYYDKSSKTFINYFEHLVVTV